MTAWRQPKRIRPRTAAEADDEAAGLLDQVLARAEAEAILAATEAIEPWVMTQQMALTSVPAPTGFEGLRAEWMLRAFQTLGLEAQIDEIGNVVAERPGKAGQDGLLAVTAHLDTAFAPGTSVEPQQRDRLVLAPGIADNGSGLAALLAIARLLRDGRVKTRRGLVLIANVGEEGEGDLKGMRHLFHPQNRLSARIRATLVLDGPGMDQITTGAVPSRRFRIVFSGPGGHSWSDLGRASAVHAAARAAAALLAQVQPQPGVRGCNIGVMQGGSVVNAIAAEAQLRLDLRADEEAGVDELTRAVRRSVAAGVEQENQAALSGSVKARIETLGDRPGGRLNPLSPLLHLVRNVDARLKLPAREQAASTDANIPIALGLDGLRLGAGGLGGGIHTPEEWFDPDGRSLALRRILMVVMGFCGLGG